jgi:hypothetical protein
MSAIHDLFSQKFERSVTNEIFFTDSFDLGFDYDKTRSEAHKIMLLAQSKMHF